MQEFLASPGMLTVLVILLFLEAISLFVLIVNIQIFRTKAMKYQALCSGFGGSTLWGKPGRVLVPLYVILTILAGIISLTLFLWQPHIL